MWFKGKFKGDSRRVKRETGVIWGDSKKIQEKPGENERKFKGDLKKIQREAGEKWKIQGRLKERQERDQGNDKERYRRNVNIYMFYHINFFYFC